MHVVVLDAILLNKGFGFLNRFLIVRANQDHAIVIEVVQDHFHAVVIATVRVFDGVPDGRLDALLGCNRSLLVHVGSSNQFDS